MMRISVILIAISIIVAVAIYFSRYFDLNIDIKPNDKDELIVVISPINNAEISSPLVVSGRARGKWYFEGSFPIVLLDKYRNQIAESHATAQGEWMTDKFVPFIGNLQFNNVIKGQKGTLVLKKDNPSGLVENDNSVEIPIIFK